jgi:hypothetical protein
LRIRLWLAVGAITAPLGVGAIVFSAVLLANQGSSAGAAPPPAALPSDTAAYLPPGLLSRPLLGPAGVPMSMVPLGPPVPNANQLFIWPAEGYVTQGMTPRHPTGVDIAAPLDSEIRAVRDGTVFFVGGDPCCSYGNYIVIGHDDGWSSVYGHLNTFLVKPGDAVKQGQVIGLSGATGHATGPHLHFELRQNGAPVNPLDFFFPARFVEVDNGPQDTLSTSPSLPPADVFAPAGEAVPTATDTPPPAGLTAAEATVLGAGWMVQNQGAAYTIAAGTCNAIQYGINWLVTCEGTLAGCVGTGPCSRYLSACVFDQPRLITRFCPQ